MTRLIINQLNSKYGGFKINKINREQYNFQNLLYYRKI